MLFSVNGLMPEILDARSFQCALSSSLIRIFHGFMDLFSSGSISCPIHVSTALLLSQCPSTYSDLDARIFFHCSEICNFKQNNWKNFTLGYFRSLLLANRFSNY
jgi:hypothetical protein